MVRKSRLASTVRLLERCLLVCVLVFLLLKILPDEKKPSLVSDAKDVLGERTETASQMEAWQNNILRLFSQRRRPVDCARLFADDRSELNKATIFQDANPKKPISPAEYIVKTQDCEAFITKNGYYTSPALPGEEDFPLAFDILVFKDVEQFERLLRAIYRPQNTYCVHVDKKSSSDLHLAVRSVSRCFDNVFVLENNVAVTWGTYSVLEPDVLCMEALLKYRKWKYFINLTGQEFPLKTNWELVQILKAINGSNLVEATSINANPERFRGVSPAPFSVTPYKGSVHVFVKREFVDYAINNETARTILNWTKTVKHASEYFFSTLNHNPQLGIPGSYLGKPETNVGALGYSFINRYKMWKSNHRLTCHGKFVRSICILGVGDLTVLGKTRLLFANKFHLDYQPLALDCLEELIHNRTKAELLGKREIDTSYYRNMRVSSNHI